MQASLIYIFFIVQFLRIMSRFITEIDTVRRLKQFLSNSTFLRDRSISSSAAEASSIPASESSTKPFWRDQNPENSIVENRNRLLLEFLDAPLSAQVQHLEALSVTVKRGQSECSGNVGSPKSRKLEPEPDLQAVENNRAISKSSTHEEGTKTSTDTVRTLDACIQPIRDRSQLQFDDAYANQLVLISEGARTHTALVLSEELYDRMFDHLDGNRKTFVQLEQNNANVSAFDERHEALKKLDRHLDQTYKTIQNMCLNGPAEAHEEALLQILKRQEDITLARQNLINKDEEDAQLLKSTEKDQLGRSWRLGQIIDDVFAQAGLQPWFELPDIESQEPEFGAGIFDDLALDLSALEQCQPANVRVPEERETQSSYSHLWEERETQSNYSQETSTIEHETEQPEPQPTTRLEVAEDSSDGVDEAFHKHSPNHLPETTEQVTSSVRGASADDAECSETDSHASESSDGSQCDDATAQTGGQDNASNITSNEDDTNPEDAPPFLMDVPAFVDINFEELEEARQEAARERAEKERIERENTEWPWSELRYGYQFVPGIGRTEVIPLGEWPALFGNSDMLRADVWKYDCELSHCETLANELDAEIEEVEEEQAAQYEVSEPLSITATHADRIADIEKRIREVKDYIRLCQVRHSIAMFRATWMGHEVDQTGRYKEGESDYFMDEVKDPGHNSRDESIEKWIREVVPGHEEEVETPELDDWDAGKEMKVGYHPLENDEDDDFAKLIDLVEDPY